MFKLALKNILYYRSRSITTLLLTFISILFFIVYVAMMDGSHKSMLQNSLKIYTSAIQIYKKGYREEGGNDYYLSNSTQLQEKIKEIKGVKAVAQRYETYGLLSHKENSAASMFVGIEPEAEKKISILKTALIKGEYLKSDSGKCVYMGSDLAKKLLLDVGEEFSFIGGASDGSFVAELFSVCGIFKTGLGEFDAGTSFVAKDYLDTLMYSKDLASYIVLNVENLDEVDQIDLAIEKKLHDSSLEYLSWKELMETMVEAMEVDSIFGYISLGLFLIVIFFVIMIYGFINVSARIKELGILRSIGLSKGSIFVLLSYEILILTFAAAVVAIPLGAYISYYFSIHPIVIEGIAQMYKDYGIVSDELPFAFDLFTIAWNSGVVILLNFLSVLYPYFYINKFTPIEAIHHV